MTRINVVPVDMLSDKHLLAEYKEITRPFNKVHKRLLNNSLKLVEIPSEYCLGKGHETFFFDKLEWLYYRYIELAGELLNRKFSLNLDKYSDIRSFILDTFYNTDLWNDYTPTPEAYYLNMARLAKRSNMVKVIEELTSKE